nr:hypothetical protein [Streptomyces sp. NRRL S-1022]
MHTTESVASQRRLPEPTTVAPAFAGTHHGWRFHDDGCHSGVKAAALGVGW